MPPEFDESGYRWHSLKRLFGEGFGSKGSAVMIFARPKGNGLSSRSIVHTNNRSCPRKIHNGGRATYLVPLDSVRSGIALHGDLADIFGLHKDWADSIISWTTK
jgi:hypothetical protein